MNYELLDVQAGFRKGRGTRDQITNICWIIEKAREFQKIIYFCFIDYAKTFDCVNHNKLWKNLKEMGIPSHLNYLLRKSVCMSRNKKEEPSARRLQRDERAPTRDRARAGPRPSLERLKAGREGGNRG